MNRSKWSDKSKLNKSLKPEMPDDRVVLHMSRAQASVLAKMIGDSSLKTLETKFTHSESMSLQELYESVLIKYEED